MNLLAKLMVLRHQILFSLAISAIAEAVLMQTSAEQVPSLHRVAPRYWNESPWAHLLVVGMLRFMS